MPVAQADAETDEDFGDFASASYSFLYSNPSSSPNTGPLSREHLDDEWGDFVGSGFQVNPPKPFCDLRSNSSFDPFSDFHTPVSGSPRNANDTEQIDASSSNLVSPRTARNQQGKPREAIPLSIFGIEEEEEAEKPISIDLELVPRDGFSPKNEVVKNRNDLPAGTGFNDLILNLYGNEERNKNENCLNLDPAAWEDDNDADSWEYKDAISENGGREAEFSFNVEIENGVTEEDLKFESMDGSINFDENEWKFPDASPLHNTADRSSDNKDAGEVLGVQKKVQTVLSFSNDELGSLDELAQEELPHNSLTFFGIGTDGSNYGSSTALSDLIMNLYDQPKASRADLVEKEKPVENGFGSAQLSSCSDLANSDHWEENDSEFKDALAYLNSSSEPVKVYPKVAELKAEIFIDVYCELKEELCFIIANHLDGLKKAKKVATLSGEQAEVKSLEEKIQMIYERLWDRTAFFGKLQLDEHLQRDIHVQDLIEVMQDPKFQAFEMEYDLLKRLKTAEKELSSAVELFEHVTSTLHILNLASEEEQSSYISAWSNMLEVCLHELQHGAMVWKQSLEKNAHLQILSDSQGIRYFVSLGEIYRVSEMLRAAVTLYKPWILSGDFMSILVRLEECKSAWIDSGLKEALESIFISGDLEHKGTIKTLQESIDVLHKLDGYSLQGLVFCQGEPICRLSLLSQRVSLDMPLVVWNGKHYFLKLANLWANKISCDPPQLPHILVSRREEAFKC